eukprot:TRINITY_DN14964_c0_g1_i1.p1 TRINITY_DN14964_c0_g1~~TRINITY_DN14964_c0_g1_i1.p1  ORF type:complete len:230 (+),score=64.26 TRINITY_DN14964_c0_g1_i1:166-855(+)
MAALNSVPVVRAVIFDLGGVVFRSPFAAMGRLENDLHLPKGSLNAVIARSGHNGPFARLERSDISFSQFVAAFEADCLRAGHRVSASVFLSAIDEATRTPNEAMIEAIKILRSRGLLTAALTNNFFTSDAAGVRRESELPTLLHGLFDQIVESRLVGLNKPDPKIYELACEGLGVRPGEAVFLDDIGRNLKAAAAVGLRTIKVAQDDVAPAIVELERVVGVSLSAKARL